jgi:hypothetical protein
MTPSLDPAALLSARLHTQHLTGTPLLTPAEVVGWLGCVQSQDPFGAKWSLAMRTTGATEGAIDAACDRGEFLRTHILRPTWHYVLPQDIRWILELTSPHILRANKGQERELELGPAVYRRTHALIEKALMGGRHLTREEIAEVLRRGKVEAMGRRLAYVMMEAELSGLVCSGAMQGKRHTYALLEERAPKGKRVGREEGVVELLRRFVAGHAPATVRHFCWWSGVRLSEARKAREALKGEQAGDLIDGVEWLGGAGPRARSDVPRTLFIPEYDEVLVGTADIGIPRLMADRRIPGRTTNTFDRPIILDGEWIGTWRRTVATKEVRPEIDRFGKWLSTTEDAVRREGARMERFLAMPVRMLRLKGGR